MKNLVAKAGVVTLGAALFTAIAPVPEAQALDIKLVPTRIDTLVYGNTSGVFSPTDAGYTVRSLNMDPAFEAAGAVEVGEYIGNEMRAFVEYDLTSFFNSVTDEQSQVYDNTFKLSFDVFTKNGSGSAGATGNNNSAAAAFEGILKVDWYTLPSPLDTLTAALFNQPNLGPDIEAFDWSTFQGSFFGSLPNDPLATFNMSNYLAGDTLTIDISVLVKEMFFNNNSSPIFGIMLTTDINNPGACGTQSQTGANRSCQGATFDNFGIVPTPAAVLPSILGLVSAAFRKKQKENQADI